MNVKKLNEYFASEFKMLDRGIVATPATREDLEAFAKANHGSMDLLLMQMAMNFGYKIAMENVKEEVTNLTKDQLRWRKY
jgi:hypothetical protein